MAEHVGKKVEETARERKHRVNLVGLPKEDTERERKRRRRRKKKKEKTKKKEDNEEWRLVR